MHRNIVSGSQSSQSKHVFALIAVMVCCVVVRFAFHYAYFPWWAGDSGGYYGSGVNIFHHHIRSYDGGRTPLVPLLMLLAEYLTHGPFDPTMSQTAAAWF